LGAGNTVVLIMSSLTMAMAVWSRKSGRRIGQYFPDSPRFGLGTVFLGVKASNTSKNSTTISSPASALT